jgi:hypothetical protein
LEDPVDLAADQEEQGVDQDSAEAAEVEEGAVVVAVALVATAADAELPPMATRALATGAALTAVPCTAPSTLRKATPLWMPAPIR